MSYAIITQIADAFFLLFGGSMMLPLIIIGVLSIILLTLRSGKVLIFLVLTPLVTTMFAYAAYSKYMQGLTVGANWVPVVMFIGLGAIMFYVFVELLGG